MTDKTLDRLRAELDEWHARLDHLRVQASLGKMEARERLHELDAKLRPSIQKATRRLDELAGSGKDEVRTLAHSLRAGWEELWRTHRELTRELEEEHAERERRARS